MGYCSSCLQATAQWLASHCIPHVGSATDRWSSSHQIADAYESAPHVAHAIIVCHLETRAWIPFLLFAQDSQTKQTPTNGNCAHTQGNKPHGNRNSQSFSPHMQVLHYESPRLYVAPVQSPVKIAGAAWIAMQSHLQGPVLELSCRGIFGPQQRAQCEQKPAKLRELRGSVKIAAWAAG